MCSSTPPKGFPSPTPRGMGAGNTATPATVYASSANPALVDASKPGATASPATGIPTTPTEPSPALGPGMGVNLPQDPYAAMLKQLGFGTT